MYAPRSRSLVVLAGTLLAPPVWAHDHRGHDERVGSVTVDNDAGVRLTVSVGGIERSVGPGDVEHVSVAEGTVTVRASYRQYGREFPLDTERVYVRAGRDTRVELERERLARIQVTNTEASPATVLVDGRTVDVVAPRSTELVTVPAGPAELVVLVEGRALERERRTYAPYAEYRVLVEGPRTGELMVYNPLPIAVVASVGGSARTLDPRETELFRDLPVGSARVTVTRLTGEFVDEEGVQVSPYARARMDVDPPRTGLVAVDSDVGFATRLVVDGRTVAALGPEARARVVLPVGWAEVEVLAADGGCVETEWVYVEPYDVARMTVAPQRVSSRDDGRGHRSASYGGR